MSKSKRKRTARVGRRIGAAIDHTVSATAGTVTHAASTAAATVGQTVGHAVTSTLRLAGITSRHTPDTGPKVAPGTVPGIEGFANRHTPPPPGTIHLTVHDVGPEVLDVTTPDDLEALLAQPVPDGVLVRWINIDGLHPWAVQRFVEACGFHTLAAEDTLHVPQRPKAEPYDDHLFAVARMMRLHGEQLTAEQVSFFMKGKLLVTFQEHGQAHHEGDVWDPVRERLKAAGSRIRQRGPDYLLYALLDAVVDHCFPVLERFGDILEDLEPQVIDDPRPELIAHIYGIKRELALLRRVLWPTRELVNVLMAETTHDISDETDRKSVV